IEAGFGGPVWHASAAPNRGERLSATDLERIARAHLQGVGDPAAGEWVEQGDIAVHIRRRLTATEALVTGPVVDVRGTPEQDQRAERAQRFLPASMLGYRE